MPAGPDVDLVQALRAQEHAWLQRPFLRALYGDWFRLIASRLSTAGGRSIELGAGIGQLHEACPTVEATDVVPTPWTDAVVDAEHLPYGDATVANLVLVDVFHHLGRPARFLDEAVRVLAPGGRVVVLDPYCSPVSYPAYRRFHHERADLRVPAFGDDTSVGRDPLASNQARSTLAFFGGRAELERRWPGLRVVERRRLALLAYPLSGGFTGRPLVPYRVGLALRALERLLRPLAPLLAFRCFVVLERVRAPTEAADRSDAELPEREADHP